MSVTRPRAAEARATGSHHSCRVNNPYVATQKPTTVSRQRARVIAQVNPDVETSLLAKAGVSHSQVVPARNRATPPMLRIVNTTITSSTAGSPSTAWSGSDLGPVAG